MLRPDVLVAQSFGLFRRIGQHPLALVGEWQVHACRNLFADGGVRFNLLADRLHRGVRAQEAVGQRLVLAQQAQQQVLGLDVRRAELAGLVPRKEDHAPRLFRIAFEHSGPPDTDYRREQPSASLAGFSPTRAPRLNFAAEAQFGPEQTLWMAPRRSYTHFSPALMPPKES